jgi:hypothetical protein
MALLLCANSALPALLLECLRVWIVPYGSFFCRRSANETTKVSLVWRLIAGESAGMKVDSSTKSADGPVTFFVD